MCQLMVATIKLRNNVRLILVLFGVNYQIRIRSQCGQQGLNAARKKIYNAVRTQEEDVS